MSFSHNPNLGPGCRTRLLLPEGRALASVLSALRGPDDDKVHNKYRTTTFIRAAAFPQLAESSARFNSGWSFHLDDKGFFDRQNIHFYDYSHFDSHIHEAAKVLGLKGKTA